MKKILHISSDFLYTDVYNQLFTSLDAKTQEQVVYSALKNNEIKTTFKSSKYLTVLSPILNFTDRVFFKKRVKKTYKDLISKINVHEYDIIHAHFLFTDGAIALKLYKEFNIPYVVAIRNTDINIYFKYFFHLRNLAFEILSNAKKVILISPSYQKKLLEYFPQNTHILLNKQITVIPNGIDRFWFENQKSKAQKIDKRNLHFLFIGEITLNKNLEQTVTLLSTLMDTYNVKFTIIGKKLDGFNQLSSFMEKYSWISYLDETKDKNVIKSYFKECDIFVMLSKYETFGLVYIESLSQGTPVIYTKGQGIDGYFPDGSVGYSYDIEKNSIDEFKKKVEMILMDYDNISISSVAESTKFDWDKIAEDYRLLYSNSML